MERLLRGAFEPVRTCVGIGRFEHDETTDCFCIICFTLSSLTFEKNITKEQVMKIRRDALNIYSGGVSVEEPMCTRHSDFFSEDHKNWKEWFSSGSDLIVFQAGRAERRVLERRQWKKIVINLGCLRKDCKDILKLHHPNIEFVHELSEYDHSRTYFVTNLFVDSLQNVWENNQEMNTVQAFIDLLQGLQYLKSRNVCSGYVHAENIAWDGKNWYLSGLIGAVKKENSSFAGNSGDYVRTCIRSPRYFNQREETLEEFLIPADDVWQLIFMFFLTKWRLFTLQWNVYYSDIFRWNRNADVVEETRDKKMFHRIKQLLFAGLSEDKQFDNRKILELLDTCERIMQTNQKDEGTTNNDMTVHENFSLSFNLSKYEENSVAFEKILLDMKCDPAS